MSMNDPFEPLRQHRAPKVRTPAVSEIRDRAQRIRTRRSALAAAGMTLTVLASFAVILRPWGGEIGHIWEGGAATSTSPAEEPRESRTPEPGGDRSQPGSFTGDPESPLDAAPPGSAVGAGDGEVSGGAAAARGSVLEVSLVLPKKAVQPRETFPMVLRVCNRSDRDVQMSFTTGQRYDFELFGNGDEPVWRWSGERVFAQALGGETWSARECRQYEGSGGSSQLPAGRYRVVGVLTAETPSRTDPLELCVGNCP